MNSGKQFGTDVERKIVHTNSNFFRAGMNWCCDGTQIKYSYGDPNQ